MEISKNFLPFLFDEIDDEVPVKLVNVVNVVFALFIESFRESKLEARLC